MRRLLPAAAPLAAALALAGCAGSRRAPAEPPEDEVWLEPGALARGGVRVERATVRDIPQVVPASGRIDFDDLHVTHVFSPVTGRISRVLAQPGQKIRKGTPLVTILSPDVGAAFSDLVKAHADLLAAEADFDRQRRLAALQANTARDVEAAEDVYRKADAEYDRAREKARLLRAGGGDAVTQEYQLVSYLDGEVVARNVSPGQEVQGQYSGGQAAELFTVGDIRRVWVLADVAARDLPRVKLGADLAVRVIAYPDRVFRGKVEWISDTLDPALRTAKVRASLENEDQALKPEMYAQVELVAAPSTALAVPRSALTRIAGQSFVWVRIGERPDGRTVFRRRLVRTPEGRGEWAEIQEGLSAGDEVVVEGAVGAEAPTGEALLSRAQIEGAEIEVAPAATVDLPDAVSLGGRLAFDDLRVTHVFSPVTGRVTRVLARPGERVRRGAPLAAILSPDVGAALADLAKAESDQAQAEHEYQRQKELFEARAGARKDLEAAESAWKKTRAELERAREKTRLLHEGQVDKVTQEFILTAPIEGEVVSRAVSPGTEVQGQYSGASSAVELFTIGDTAGLWVLADAYEVDLPRIHEGDPVEIQVAAAPGRTFRGRIDWISDVLDPQVRTLKVRCAIENPDRLLKPEMYEAVTVHVPGRRVVTVPRQALLRVGEERLVIVAKDARADGSVPFERRVVLADEGRADGPVAIQGGLAGGERVVIRGAILVLGAF
ncbi:MAG TPA: efflux RND transporter periplasmic adaptor subunit [Anaeromyxobacter sp.]|nr:efflux RND transporter periplasmic adaptor subunit [Anaeromyxobacter sp.]